MSQFKMISFDGGGIRGLVSLGILRRLQEGHPGLLEETDMFSGTSTGGIIALGLASGLNVDYLINMYLDSGENIFARRWSHALGLFGAKYTHRYLKQLLVTIFGNLKLGDLHKKVLIPTFDLDNEKAGIRRWKPKFFHNFDAPDADLAVPVWQVCMYTSAAPTYFKSYDGYIDGGMIANNSSISAVVQALDARHNGAHTLDDIRLLSVGTGETSQYVKGSEVDFGATSVATLMKIVLEGTKDVPDHQCHVLLADHYRRLNPFNYKGYEMDDWRHADYFVKLGNSTDLLDVPEWLKTIWQENS